MAGGDVPANLAPLFVQAGSQYKIPPQVLAGVASVESNLGANATTSSAGAVGMMQFLPSTAKSIGVNPNDPRSAIFGAAKLLNSYGFQQNPLRAIGAYNGGPGNPQMGYANQVMSEANRLKSQLAGTSTPSIPTLPAAPSPASQTGFDQAGYQKALGASIAGNFLKGNAKSPFDIGPKTGLGSGASPLFSAGGLTTKAPNPTDYVTAQAALQNVAGSPVAAHPAVSQGAMNGAAKAGGRGLPAAVNAANSISANHYNYEWGGGHNPTFAPTHGTGHGSGVGTGFDCSGAVSAILHSIGLLGSPMVAQQFENFGQPGPGGPNDITIYASGSHVFMQMGGKFFGTSSGNPGGGAGWFSSADTSGFVARHVTP